jgi:hypothetical protein
MPIDITELSDLSTTNIETSKTLLREMLEEEHATLDFSDGTVNNQLIVQPNAEIDVLHTTNTDRLRQSNSLEAISDDPTLADDDIVDAALSNFLVTRRAGTYAAGTVNVVIGSQTPFSIATTAVLTINSRTFNPISNYTVFVSDSLTESSTDLLLRERTDGNWWVSIQVKETAVAGALVEQGSAFTMSPEPVGLVEAVAAEDFTVGTAEETNAELIARLEDGTAIKGMAGRTSITALLTDQYSQILDTSIIGFSDDESIRDARNVLGINNGGKGDIYLRTGLLPTRTKITVVADYTGTQENMTAFGYSGFFRDYRTGVSVDSVAGFYRAARVTYFNPAGVTPSGGFDGEFTKDATRGGFSEDALRETRSVNETFSPAIGDPIEATYSRYQGTGNVTVVRDIPTNQYLILFEELVDGYSATEQIQVDMGTGSFVNKTIADLRTLVQDGTKRVYDIYVDVMPSLSTIQTYVNGRNVRAPGADYLVKGGIPCFMTVGITISYIATGTAPNVTNVRNAASGAVNGTLFAGTDLSALTIVSAVQAVIPTTAQVDLPLSMRGTLRLSDGVETVLTGTNTLAIPDNSDTGATRRTVCYFLRPADVTVTLQAI